ncbi:hypothetical protein SEA_OZZIE_67 [Streptomyces phage Ozzie]|uniref:Uncharacterized protein n=1 Tax=Streptomyces phage Ozzie TaxID=2024293 RepID=A0A291AWT8_9CAUD|nr:hypothetical protein SEA_OZZIE_67 [Streptomyces phage Ozzie]
MAGRHRGSSPRHPLGNTALSEETIMSKVTREQAEQVLAKLEELYPLDKGYFFLADHDHEGLPEGSWSIALEGWDWTYEVSERQHTNPEDFPEGVFLEPIASWCLGIYPA